MNMLYEGLKENATIVIVPSTAVESMQLGGLAGLTALTMGLGQDGTIGNKTVEPTREVAGETQLPAVALESASPMVQVF
jgi:hypothetical protein